MSISPTIGSGLAGAAALNILHEVLRRSTTDAPRMDWLGKEVLAKSLKSVNIDPPKGTNMDIASLAGDILGNGGYYTIIGMGDPETAPLRGLLVGAAAGAGAILIPKYTGLNEKATNKNLANQALTIGLYALGGLAAGLAAMWIGRHKKSGQVQKALK
ncbi:MAG: hypothetical protein V4543_08215 [Bacteroidota bacterium]